MNNKTGLLNINCLFVGDSLNEIYDTFCVSMITSVYYIALLTIIMGLSLYVGFICSFRIATMFANIKKLEEELKQKEKKYK